MKTKKILIAIFYFSIFYLIAFLIAYIPCSIAETSFNITKWCYDTRKAMSIGLSCVGALFTLLSFLIIVSHPDIK